MLSHMLFLLLYFTRTSTHTMIVSLWLGLGWSSAVTHRLVCLLHKRGLNTSVHVLDFWCSVFYSAKDIHFLVWADKKHVFSEMLCPEAGTTIVWVAHDVISCSTCSFAPVHECVYSFELF